jgi:hypothetical protein
MGEGWQWAVGGSSPCASFFDPLEGRFLESSRRGAHTGGLTFDPFVALWVHSSMMVAQTIIPATASAHLPLGLLVFIRRWVRVWRGEWSSFLAFIHDDKAAATTAPDAKHQALAGQVLGRAFGVLCAGDWFAIDLLNDVAFAQSSFIGG